MKEIKILAINPGSTSTKIAVYRDSEPIFLKNIKHSPEDFVPFHKIADQFHFRKDIILQQLYDADISLEQVHAVMGRGGLLKPIPSGVYEVNEAMIHDAHDIAIELPDAKAYIADPIVVDELDDIARISGHPLFERVSIFHALNHKAIAREYAKANQKQYE